MQCAVGCAVHRGPSFHILAIGQSKKIDGRFAVTLFIGARHFLFPSDEDCSCASPQNGARSADMGSIVCANGAFFFRAPAQCLLRGGNHVCSRWHLVLYGGFFFFLSLDRFCEEREKIHEKSARSVAVPFTWADRPRHADQSRCPSPFFFLRTARDLSSLVLFFSWLGNAWA